MRLGSFGVLHPVNGGEDGRKMTENTDTRASDSGGTLPSAQNRIAADGEFGLPSFGEGGSGESSSAESAIADLFGPTSFDFSSSEPFNFNTDENNDPNSDGALDSKTWAMADS